MIAPRAFWLLIPVLLIAAACGGGDSTSSTSTSTSTTSSAVTTLSSSPEASSSADAVDDLCPLLPQDDVFRTTGYNLLLAQFHNGPGPLHFCTLYLDIPACNEECALSLEDLGAVDPNAYNTPDAYRETLLTANPDAGVTFKDNALGENSWLGTAQSGDLVGFKIAYFQVKDVAYDLTSPRVAAYTLTEAQFLGAAQAVIDNLNK